MIDWIALSQQVPQFAALIIVVIFALQMSKANREYIQTLVSGWKVFFESQSEDWRGFIERQEVRFVQTLETINKQHSESTARLAEEIKDNSRRLENLHGKIDASKEKK